ncbi:hypothetical protein [Solimonas sp. SE-A11]|uniref:hypothetical protein n=1 Tax=Solimonas sp. SE-A11 TaxID=3054954 RepID=UPI00259CD87F|nr:hypothetical protein [Solimonas sp. SE-A11]MDM4770928.1 hypothetical protein [Solimonas sp. SE-A11]
MNEAYDTRNTVSAFLKILEIDRTTFEQYQNDASIQFLDIVSVDYDSFNQKRETLKQKMLEAGFSSHSHTSIVRTLSPEAARAYSQCVSEQTKGLIAAWVSAVAGSIVSVTVKTGFGGHANIEYKVDGAEPKNHASLTYNLSAGGIEILQFDVKDKKDFMITINARETNIDMKDGVSLTLEGLKRWTRKVDTQTLSTTIRVGAGCHGSSSGCQINVSGTIVAPTDWYLLPGTVRRTDRKILGGPGVRDWGLSKDVATYNDQAYRIDLYPFSVDGNSGHAQGIEEITYVCDARREYFVMEYE